MLFNTNLFMHSVLLNSNNKSCLFELKEINNNLTTTEKAKNQKKLLKHIFLKLKYKFTSNVL